MEDEVRKKGRENYVTNGLAICNLLISEYYGN
jgi:hypothetical protein